MSYTRTGNRLLLSLIVSTILAFVLFGTVMLVSDENTGSNTVGENAIGLLFLANGLYWWIALGGGIVLKIMGSRQTNTLEKEAIAYAETRNWQQITKTSWRKYMRNGVVFSVSAAYSGRSWNLSIEGDGEHLALSGFDRPLLGLQFADSIYERVIANQSRFDAEEVRRSQEWQAGLLQLTEGRRQ